MILAKAKAFSAKDAGLLAPGSRAPLFAKAPPHERHKYLLLIPDMKSRRIGNREIIHVRWWSRLNFGTKQAKDPRSLILELKSQLPSL